MSLNLLEAVQEKMGYAPLKKIDPNTQDVVMEPETVAEHTFEQAAIPSILIAFFKYVALEEGATAFIQETHRANWVNYIFGNNTQPALEAIATYSNLPVEGIDIKLNAIADEVLTIAKQTLTPTAEVNDVQLFFNEQKNNILLYLPAELNMGKLLNDGTLDDQTNKMEGPISSLISSIGAVFSTPVTAEVNH